MIVEETVPDEEGFLLVSKKAAGKRPLDSEKAVTIQHTAQNTSIAQHTPTNQNTDYHSAVVVSMLRTSNGFEILTEQTTSTQGLDMTTS